MHNVKVTRAGPHRDDDPDAWIEVVVDLSDLPGLALPEDDKDTKHRSAHRIIFRPEALADRMVVYGLADEHEALQAIVREHALRLSELDPAGDEHAHRLGGLDDRFNVHVAEPAREGAAGLFAAHAEAITAHADRLRTT